MGKSCAVPVQRGPYRSHERLTEKQQGEKKVEGTRSLEVVTLITCSQPDCVRTQVIKPDVRHEQHGDTATITR